MIKRRDYTLQCTFMFWVYWKSLWRRKDKEKDGKRAGWKRRTCTHKHYCKNLTFCAARCKLWRCKCASVLCPPPPPPPPQKSWTNSAVPSQTKEPTFSTYGFIFQTPFTSNFSLQWNYLVIKSAWAKWIQNLCTFFLCIVPFALQVFQALDRKTRQLNQKQVSDLAFHLIFHCLTVVYVSFCSLIKGITLNIYGLCFCPNK